MTKNPPSEIQKLRMKLARSGSLPTLREQTNIQVLTCASQEALAVASPANRPIEYLNALYKALMRARLGQIA